MRLLLSILQTHRHTHVHAGTNEKIGISWKSYMHFYKLVNYVKLFFGGGVQYVEVYFNIACTLETYSYACVCVPTVCEGHWVPLACGGVCSQVCWRSESAHWPLKLLQMSPPLCQWYGYYSSYCTEWEASREKSKAVWIKWMTTSKNRFKL